MKEITVKNTKTEQEEKVEVDGVFIEIGSVVKTDFLEGIVDRDELGHIKINSFAETSQPGIFAAGDVRAGATAQAAAAAGEGATVALMIRQYLESVSV